MSLTSDPSRIPYELYPPELEQGVVRLCVVSPSFWERAGRFFDPERLGKLEAKEVVRAVGEIIRDTGKHPGQVGGVPLVVQRIQRKSTEAGRLTRAQVAACYEYLCSAPADLGEDQAVAEVAPILKRALRQQLSKHASNAVAPGNEEQSEGEVRKALAAIDEVGRGKQLLDSGAVEPEDLGPALAIARLPRVPFGIPELDGLMRGGPQKGKFGFGCAYSGQGKSMLLNHWVCNAARQKLFSIYFTGEVIRGDEVQRMVSNLTSVPMDAMTDDPKWEEEAALRYRFLVESNQIRKPILRPFKATVTTVNELFEIVEEEERRAGQRADLIVFDADEHIDYTKIDFPGYEQLLKKDPGTYQGFGRLYAYLSYQAKGGQEDPTRNPSLCRCVGTVSQVKGEPNKARFKVLTGEEAADSKRKIRIADWCVTANYHYVQEGTIFYVSKGRHSAAQTSTPALGRYFECAQMVRVQDDYPWVGNPREWRKKQYTFWKGI